MLDQARVAGLDAALVDAQSALHRPVGARERSVLVAVTDPAQAGVGLEDGQQLTGQAVGVVDGQSLIGELSQRFHERRGAEDKALRVRDGAAAHLAEQRVGKIRRAGRGAAVGEPGDDRTGQQHEAADAGYQLRSIAEVPAARRGRRLRLGLRGGRSSR